MAIIFELVLNFGCDRTAADAARELVLSHPPLTAGRHQIHLHKPSIRTARGCDGERYLEVSIIPIGVAWAMPLDHDHERLLLTAAELSELGNGLYQVLRQITGYRAAQVGWDPEGHVDPAELRQDWADELAAGQLPGLVLAEDLHQHLDGQGFVSFAPGYVWIPYQGEAPSTLTADGRRD